MAVVISVPMAPRPLETLVSGLARNAFCSEYVILARDKVRSRGTDSRGNCGHCQRWPGGCDVSTAHQLIRGSVSPQ